MAATASNQPATLDISLILRGAAAIQVVIWHTVGYSMNGGLARFIDVSGRQCVWIFFALSGYFVSHGFFTGRYLLRSRDILDYTLARFFRIVPLYVVVTLITFGILYYYPHGSMSDYGPMNARTLISALLFVPVSSTFPGVFWTIVIEVKFYLLVPALFWAYQALHRNSKSIPPIVPMLILYALFLRLPHRLWQTPPVSLDDRTLPGNFGHFLAGFMVHDIGRLSFVRSFAARKHAPAILTVAAALALMAGTALYHDTNAAFWTTGSVLTDAAAVFSLLVHRIMVDRAVPAGRLGFALAAMGTIAYGIYSWHGVILTAAPSVEHNLAAVLGGALILAAVSYFVLERPALRFRQRLIKRAFLGTAA